MIPTRRAALTQLLQRLGIEKAADISTLILIDQGLTHISTWLEQNHEKLEFLVDEVLRLTTMEFRAQTPDVERWSLFQPASSTGKRSLAKTSVSSWSLW